LQDIEKRSGHLLKDVSTCLGKYQYIFGKMSVHFLKMTGHFAGKGWEDGEFPYSRNLTGLFEKKRQSPTR
jgi:hypothetical protein